MAVPEPSGPAPVTLASFKLLIRGLPRGTSIAPMDWVVQTPSNLPIRLEPGDHWTGMIQAASVRQSLDEKYGGRDRWFVRPVLTGTADRSYRAAISRGGWRRPPTRWVKLDR